MIASVFANLEVQATEIGASIIFMREDKSGSAGSLVLRYDSSPHYGTARYALASTHSATLFCHDRYYERTDAIIATATG